MPTAPFRVRLAVVAHAAASIGALLLLLGSPFAHAGEPATSDKTVATVDAPQLSYQLIPKQGFSGWSNPNGATISGWSNKDGKFVAGRDATDLQCDIPLGDFEMEIARRSDRPLMIYFVYAAADEKGRRLGSGGVSPSAVGLSVKPADGVLCLNRKGAKVTWGTGPDREEHDINAKGPVYVYFYFQGPQVGLAPPAVNGEGTIESIVLHESAGPDLFGADLADWSCPGKKEAWKLADGVLTKEGTDGNYLRSNKEYGDFTLSLSYKIAKGGNSGIGIRTPRDGWPSGDGMELQILDHKGIDGSSTMAIYRNVAPFAKADKSEEWNDLVIKASGRTIAAWVNGEFVQYANTQLHPELKFRHLRGWIGFQDHGARIEFTNVRLREDPVAEPSSRRPYDVTEMILDRALNTQAIAQNDGLRSVHQAAKIAGKGEELLASFDGPGAFTGLWGSPPKGELRLYFDGEAKPRVVCPLDKSWQKLPRFAESSWPLVTCVPFGKSLKVMLHEGGPGRYGADATLSAPSKPGATANEALPTQASTFVDVATSIPRGWLEAIDYRCAHHQYGNLRERDPAKRTAKKVATLKPGERAELIKLDDAGVVQWLRLESGKSWLSNDSLWIEVTCDGATEPAISVPAKIYFAPIVDGRYQNLLMTDAGGPVSLLAMPFGKGLVASLVNRGKKPIDDVGLAVAYEPLAADKIPAMRLGARATAESATGDERKLVVKGAARIVGIVCNSPRDQAPNLTLRVDGQTPEAFDGLSLDELAGAPEAGKDFRGIVSGHFGPLAWRFLPMSPIDAKTQCELSATPTDGAKLGLFYYQAAP